MPHPTATLGPELQQQLDLPPHRGKGSYSRISQLQTLSAWPSDPCVLKTPLVTSRGCRPGPPSEGAVGSLGRVHAGGGLSLALVGEPCPRPPQWVFWLTTLRRETVFWGQVPPGGTTAVLRPDCLIDAYWLVSRTAWASRSGHVHLRQRLGGQQNELLLRPT